MTKKENEKNRVSTSAQVHLDLPEVSVVLDGNDVKQELTLVQETKSHNSKPYNSKKHKLCTTSPERKKTKFSTPKFDGINDMKPKFANSLTTTKTSITNMKAKPMVQDEFDHHIRRKSLSLQDRSDLRFKHLYFVHESNPGSCLSVHCYQDDLDGLSPSDRQEFLEEFLDFVFEEDPPGFPRHVLGVVHDSGRYIPDPLEHMADKYPNLIVKRTMMGKSDIDTLKMDAFRHLVHSTYSAGTYRCGPLLQVSLVGAKSEECGDYFPDVLDLLETNQFIKAMMPWGKRSCLEGTPRETSDDGPILWSRPGEQVIPTVDLPKSPNKKKRGINELKNLMYLPRSGESREILVEDRTKCHADQVGDFLEKKTTAAVGLLKAVHAGESCRTNRVVKEVTCFDPKNFDTLVDKLKLDLHEPPMTQCVTWIDEARLNQLAREGIGFSTLRLRDNDVYFIPRKVIHQFRTVSAVTSIAWHVRLRKYHEPMRDDDVKLGENALDTKVEVSASKCCQKKENKGRKKARKSESKQITPRGVGHIDLKLPETQIKAVESPKRQDGTTGNCEVTLSSC